MYDSRHRRVATINPEGERSTVVYNKLGLAKGTIDAEGNRTTTTFDVMNRRETFEDAEGNVSSTVYDDRGSVVKTIDALGRVMTTVYDDLGQQVQTIDASSKSSYTVRDAAGRAVASIDSEDRTSSSYIDLLGRQVASEDHRGNVALKEYDASGNLISETDPLGNKTEYRYNELNQLVETEDAEGGVTTQGWDEKGNRTSITDPVGNTTTFVYNSLNRETERIDPHGNSLTYAYDDAGRMTSQTDRLDRRKDFTYDDAGRLTKEVWKDASKVTVNTFTFAYDNNGNLLTAQDDEGIYTMTYDGLNRMETQDGLFANLTFTYNAVGNRTVLEDSKGGVLTSSFDNNNRLETRKFDDGTTTLRYDLTYNEVGQVTLLERFSNLAGTTKVGESAYTYTTEGWLSTIDHDDGSSTNLASYAHDYDAAGRLTKETKNNSDRDFGYDDTNQVTDDDGVTYTYDANGNRTMTGYTTGTGNQLTNDGTFTYTYDAEGNLSTKSKGPSLEKWYYTYDNDNRLETVRKTSNGSTDVLRVTYAYDAFDHRVEKELWESGVGTTTERYVYDGEEIILDLNGSNVVQMRYIIGEAPDEMIARIDGNNTLHWYLTDRMGTVRDLVDSSGSLAKTIDYDVFGKITSETATGIALKRSLNGMVYEARLGFNTTNNRVYMIDAGRWIQNDFIWFDAQDANLYRFVNNNLTNKTDPTGLLSIKLGRPFSAVDWVFLGNLIRIKGIKVESKYDVKEFDEKGLSAVDDYCNTRSLVNIKLPPGVEGAIELRVYRPKNPKGGIFLFDTLEKVPFNPRKPNTVRHPEGFTWQMYTIRLNDGKGADKKGTRIFVAIYPGKEDRRKYICHSFTTGVGGPNYMGTPLVINQGPADTIFKEPKFFTRVPNGARILKGDILVYYFVAKNKDGTLYGETPVHSSLVTEVP